MKTHQLARLALPLGVSAVALAAINAQAAPAVGQLTPVAIYHDTHGAFGIAFDTANSLIWYSQGDSGDDKIHSIKPFNSYTPAELAALPDLGGVKQISLAAGFHDIAGTTSPAGTGGSGSGAHFSSLAFDSSSGKIVYQSSGDLKAIAPFAVGGEASYSGVSTFFTDGLDVDGPNLWHSPDVGDIFKNGAFFASAASAVADGGPSPTFGFSGVEQVGDSVFAVAVGSYGGHERTIFKFDAASGDLVGYDPDGDPAAVRWEDMAFDGRYLYAADLRGNADGAGPAGDIYVFDTGGGIIIPPPNGVPDAGSTFMLLSGALVSLMAVRRRIAR